MSVAEAVAQDRGRGLAEGEGSVEGPLRVGRRADWFSWARAAARDSERDIAATSTLSAGGLPLPEIEHLERAVAPDPGVRSAHRDQRGRVLDRFHVRARAARVERRDHSTRAIRAASLVAPAEKKTGSPWPTTMTPPSLATSAPPSYPRTVWVARRAPLSPRARLVAGVPDDGPRRAVLLGAPDLAVPSEDNPDPAPDVEVGEHPFEDVRDRDRELPLVPVEPGHRSDSIAYQHLKLAPRAARGRDALGLVSVGSGSKGTNSSLNSRSAPAPRPPPRSMPRRSAYHQVRPWVGR